MFRGILDNVLSGMKAGFKAILNLFKHPNGESRMFNLKSSSKLSATLLALVLGASVFMAGQVWAAKYVTDPTTGKVVVAPQYAPESIIAIIYLQWVVFGMIFEELNPARHWLVLPVGIKGRSPKSIAGKIEQSDMSFRPINGFVSYSVLKKDIVFCPKCSGFGIPVQQNSLDNFLRVPIERKLTGNKVLVFAMLCIQICFFDDKSFLNPRII